ncbi:MAG: protein translocase subunit SecF [Chlamydiales bacterium]
MEKQKRWQLFFILAVLFLTIYNILPTLFYYSKPLKKPIGPVEAEKVACDIIARVNKLEGFTLSWLRAQSKNLGLKPLEIKLDKEDPRLVQMRFQNQEEASFFSKTLYRAGALIPFTPAQLSSDPSSSQEENRTVGVQRHVGIHFDQNKVDTYFTFIPKITKEGDISPEYRDLIYDRSVELALGFGGLSHPGRIMIEIAQEKENDEEVIHLARSLLEYENAFGDENPITKRYYESFTQVPDSFSQAELIQKFIRKLEAIDQNLTSAIAKIQEEQKDLKTKGKFLDSFQEQQLEVFENQKKVINAATIIVRRNSTVFEKGTRPLERGSILELLSTSILQDRLQSIDIGKRNPFIKSIEIEWNKDQLTILLHPEVNEMRAIEANSEIEAIRQETLDKLLFSTISTASQMSGETIKPSLKNFAVTLNQLTNSSSLLRFDIGAVAAIESKTIANMLKNRWQPKEGELSSDSYPLYFYEEFKHLPPQEKKLGIVIYAPAMESTPEIGFRNNSIYVIARGLNAIREKYQNLPDSHIKSLFEQEFHALQDLMRKNGFIAYPGKASNLPISYRNDYIFELDDYYSYLIAATREDFSIKGSKHYATLEFTDIEQRILALNKIETQIHEDLIKWHDEYRQTRASIDPKARYDVPPPIKNVLWDNLKLSFVKYFRGDERKILKWGLDLSGGKTVRIGLRDQNHQLITNEADLKQAVNELYKRVNRLGLSEVGIRTEGATMVLDFPGSQGLSARDLIQASAMYFHVVNEKFTANNPILGEAVNAFLEEVWNEAVIMNRTDPESLNEIAWKHLGGSQDSLDDFHPLTSHAQLLYEHGLRFAGPKSPPSSSGFDDSLSAISLFRGADYVDWQGQTYPLLIIFRNYALEGSNLDNIHTGYDPSEGNTLQFGIKSSSLSRSGEKINPRDDFYSWTSHFSEEKIGNTPKEAFSQGRGWRMAVILNGSIISAPALNSPLRESARITGHFSQREINQLAADLKAGSLRFTPYILSEENISPDLGKEQRIQGIFAALLGLTLVFLVMISYYRFSGLIASLAVLFNLLIIWGVLQNLGSALTLPSIAGVILAVGMSVDANVLVFERIREEFSISKRLPSSLAAGYRKAFSAILDSNLTTILAALILLNFDAGPVKGFALTLIIGIISSMFTSLFVTRYFFAGWIQNPKHKILKMMSLFGKTKIDFLKNARFAITFSMILVVIGLGFLLKEWKTIFGIDFTGGYALTIDLKEQPTIDYRTAVEKTLNQMGAYPSDFQIKELNKPNQLRIQLGMSMEEEGKPFHNIDEQIAIENVLFPYQRNPRIQWIVNGLQNHGLELNPHSLPHLNLYWTAMSGQLSETMRNQALIGLGLALLSILIYITFRFEFKYAISATLALAHDLLITIGLLALLHLFFEGIKIDLQVIAALMTIIGYSLNDTIIIFDRIREDIRILRKLTFSEIVNHALNATLTRTVMTSGTTLVVLLALVTFGGRSIFNFSLIMTLGVIIGTLSSLYIAAPILIYFEKLEVNQKVLSSKKS